MTYILSWGHSHKIRSFRVDFDFEYNPQTENYDPIRTNANIEGKGGRDYIIHVANYHMQFNNGVLLPGSSDHAWRTPLQTVIRIGRGSKARKRSAPAEARRAAKRRGYPSGRYKRSLPDLSPSEGRVTE